MHLKFGSELDKLLKRWTKVCIAEGVTGRKFREEVQAPDRLKYHTKFIATADQ
jgi:hypothetical protein